MNLNYGIFWATQGRHNHSGLSKLDWESGNYLQHPIHDQSSGIMCWQTCPQKFITLIYSLTQGRQSSTILEYFPEMKNISAYHNYNGYHDYYWEWDSNSRTVINCTSSPSPQSQLLLPNASASHCRLLSFNWCCNYSHALFIYPVILYYLLYDWPALTIFYPLLIG